MATEAPRLVFGDDGSAAADVVWLWINNHAWPGWRISLVTAQPPAPGPPVDPERSTLHPWTPPAPRQLFAAGHAGQVEYLTAEADPRIVLDSCDDATLVAVGPRGRGLLKRLHIGSTTEWLISGHRPLAPLVIVRSARLTERILLCVDGSTHSLQAAHTLATLPLARTSAITVLGVPAPRAHAERGVDEAVDVLRAAGIRAVDPQLVAAIPQTATFDPRSIILDAIVNLEPQIVAIGTHGTGGLQRAFVGSTASAVVHHAPCSVLLARAPDPMESR